MNRYHGTGILHQANSWKEVADFLVAGILLFSDKKSRVSTGSMIYRGCHQYVPNKSLSSRGFHILTNAIKKLLEIFSKDGKHET
ncbi:MAG: hypothetical protein DRH90_00720 [Deltaproteobacteria bacterium]|nr:MAG: hypothetical protein DRH90_00720 [Deltaproteobacteria bacterium]RLC17418.1 MAG: hypothetical protein DRI24_05825 [Deltaproteobacteria bacterium]